jgi:hypothetical protein
MGKETVTIDISEWTQEQKNMLQAMSVQVLFDAKVDYSAVAVTKGGAITCELSDPGSGKQPTDLSAILTQKAVEAAYAAWKSENDAATAAANAEAAAVAADAGAAEIRALDLVGLKAMIEKAQSVEDLRVVLDKLCCALRQTGAL